MRLIKSTIILCFISLMVSCASDVVEPAEGCDLMEATYETNVKNIIDQTCAYSGCHDGAGGIGPGNYKSYQGLLQDLQSGSLGSRVLTRKNNPSLGMPPDKSVYPQSQQDSLSAIQLEIITCWLQGGFPE